MRISVDGRRIRNNKVTFSNLSGIVWTGPKQIPFCNFNWGIVTVISAITQNILFMTLLSLVYTKQKDRKNVGKVKAMLGVPSGTGSLPFSLLPSLVILVSCTFAYLTSVNLA